MIVLALLAPFCVLQSEMPRAAAWPLAVVAGAWGLGSAWREWRRPRHRFEMESGVATLDGRPLAMADIRWRGPLAFLQWRGEDGRGGRLVWWPDTLPAGERRGLKVNAALIRPLRGHLLPHAGEGVGVAP